MRLLQKNKIILIWILFSLHSVVFSQLPVELLDNMGSSQTGSFSAFEEMEASQKEELMMSFFNGDDLSGSLNSKTRKKDSSKALFHHPDSVLMDPSYADSAEILRLKEAQSTMQNEKRSGMRYSQKIFQEIDPSVFGTTTNGIHKNYPIKPGDQLILSIWGETEFETDLTVTNQGGVFIRNIGMVNISGLTLSQATKAIKTKMSRVNSGVKSGKTKINLRMNRLSPIKVFIVGEAIRPGAYVFHGNTSVMQALYFANGPTDIGSVRNIQIKREDSIFSVDLYNYLFSGSLDSGAILQDGDVVLLPRADVLAGVFGDVGHEAIFELKSENTLEELLSFSRGLNVTASQQGYSLKRINSNGAYDFIDLPSPNLLDSTNLSFSLQNGDLLQIKISTHVGKENISVQGAVYYPGAYHFEDGNSAGTLIQKAGGLKEHAYNGRFQVIRPYVNGKVDMLSFPMEKASEFKLKPLDTLVVYSSRALYTPDSVSISGAVRKPGFFAYQDGMKVKDLILLAGGMIPGSKTDIARIDRKNGKTTEVSLIEMQNGMDADHKEAKVLPWDHIEIPFDPEFSRPEKVVLSGAFLWPGTYVLEKKDESIQELIKRAGGFKPEAYPEGSRFFRRFKSDSLEQIGLNLPEALKSNELFNIPLQHGDSIHVPNTWVSVKITGEVGYPSNVLFKNGKSIWYYIDRAGGLTRNSDDDRIRIRYADGSVATLDGMERVPDPGSEIIVPHKPEDEPFDWLKALGSTAQILASLAVIFVSIEKIYE